MPLPNLFDAHTPPPRNGSLFVRFTANGKQVLNLLPCSEIDRRWSVGRGPNADIDLESMNVSSRHAEIWLQAGTFAWIEGEPTNASVFATPNFNRRIIQKRERFFLFSGVVIELPGVRVTFIATG